jgi:putative transposase
LIEPGNALISLRRQSELLGVSRSTLYYERQPISIFDLELMNLLDEQYTRTPFYGTRRMTWFLRTQGYDVNRKRVKRLLRTMGLHAIYPGPRMSVPSPGHKIYPYLLRGVRIDRPNQVWSSDITYIRLRGGFVYLMAVIDWFSRYVVAWELSVAMDAEFCVSGLERALSKGKPEIFNTDQGSQFTSLAFTGMLNQSDVLISMDGRGRALDNVFVERLWRTIKYEDIYLKDYGCVPEVRTGLKSYFDFYNNERGHQSLGYKTPAAIHLK